MDNGYAALGITHVTARSYLSYLETVFTVEELTSFRYHQRT
jgi:predicted AAA+ superfamily ATPase